MRGVAPTSVRPALQEVAAPPSQTGALIRRKLTRRGCKTTKLRAQSIHESHEAMAREQRALVTKAAAKVQITRKRADTICAGAAYEQRVTARWRALLDADLGDLHAEALRITRL